MSPPEHPSLVSRHTQLQSWLPIYLPLCSYCHVKTTSYLIFVSSLESGLFGGQKWVCFHPSKDLPWGQSLIHLMFIELTLFGASGIKMVNQIRKNSLLPEVPF